MLRRSSGTVNVFRVHMKSATCNLYRRAWRENGLTVPRPPICHGLLANRGIFCTVAARFAGFGQLGSIVRHREMLKKRGLDGGRDRTRTCDLLRVNPAFGADDLHVLLGFPIIYTDWDNLLSLFADTLERSERMVLEHFWSTACAAPRSGAMSLSKNDWWPEVDRQSTLDQLLRWEDLAAV